MKERSARNSGVASETRGHRTVLAMLAVGVVLAGCKCGEKTAALDAGHPELEPAFGQLKERVGKGVPARIRRALLVPAEIAPRGDPRFPTPDLFEATKTWQATIKPAPAPKEASRLVDAVLLAATRTDARLPSEGVSDALIEAIGNATVEAAQLDVAQHKRTHACWAGLAVVRLGFDVDPRFSAVADRALVTRGLRLVQERLGEAATGGFPAAELKELLAGCLTLDEGPQTWLGDLRERAFIQEQAALEALSTQPLGPLGVEIEQTGGVGAWLERHDAEVAVAEKLVGKPLAAAPAVMAELAGEQKRIWGAKGSSLSLLAPQTFAAWAWREARVRGTCVTIAVALDETTRGALAPDLAALVPAVLPEVPVDPLGAGPWEYTPDGVGGRLLRSGPIELAGKPERVELGIDAPPTPPVKKH